MKILVIGSGAREDALLWKLAQSPHKPQLFVAPGNGGTNLWAENIDLRIDDVHLLRQFAIDEKIDLVVVGPEGALAEGIVDIMREQNILVFGPTRAAARIETSKQFAKSLMSITGIRYPKTIQCSSREEALQYINSSACKFPCVIKDDGLRLGRGVRICNDLKIASRALDDLFQSKDSTVLIEEFIRGYELSAHVLVDTDGKTISVFPLSQDHKALRAGNKGPNTGGMGVIAPAPWVPRHVQSAIRRRAITSMLEELTQNGTPFTGCLYPGLMITPSEEIFVLEYNARLGDPETPAYMRILDTDLVKILLACVTGSLANIHIKWQKEFAVSVVVASGGYGEVEKPITGYPISGIHEASKLPGIVIFHAGTRFDGKTYYTAGGRVLNVTATAPTLEAAIKRAYAAVGKIQFPNMQFRSDIGKEALQLIQKERRIQRA